MGPMQQGWRRAAAALAGAVVLMTASAGADVMVIRVAENVPLVANPPAARGWDIPGLAVNPGNPDHVVAVSNEFVSGNCDHHVSFDAGVTWETGHLRGPAGFPSPPCPRFDNGGYAHTNGSLAFGAGQNVYTTFSSRRFPESDSIIVAKSSDGGRTFAPGVVAIAGPPGGSLDFIRPKLAVAPNPAGDKVFVVAWGCESPPGISGGGACNRTVSNRSLDGGQSWASVPVDVSLPSDGLGAVSSQPAVGPDGAVYVVYPRSPQTEGRGNLVLATSRDDGASWSRSDVGTVRGQNQPKLVVDPRNGALYLATHATPVATDDQDIVFLRRPPGATAWSAPVRVNDDPVGNRAGQVLPWLSLAPSGRLDLIWRDRRHPYPGNRLEDYYAASSTDGGATWSANRRLTDRTINLAVGLDGRIGASGFYWPALAPLDDGRALAAWGDSRLGSFDTDSQDIFRTTLYFGAGVEPEVRPLSGRSGAGDLVVEASRLAYPGGLETAGGVAATRVVIVNHDDVGRALAGSVLARARLGPLVPTPAAGLPPALAAEVGRMGAAGAVLVGDEQSLPPKVVDDVVAAGVPREKVARIAGATPAESAKAVAEALDTRTANDRTAGRPAFGAAVIANPQGPSGPAAAALAASLRLPFLLVDADAVPAPTAEAMRSLGIDKTLVVGPASEVSEGILAALPTPKRLAGDDQLGTSVAILGEARDRGLPTNVAYVADASRPVEAAVLGATAARLGGLLVLAPQADAGAARSTLHAAGLGDKVDRLVTAGDSTRPAPASPAARPPAASGGGLLPATGGGLPVRLALLGALAGLALHRGIRWLSPTASGPQSR